MPSFGIGWAASAEVVNKRFDPLSAYPRPLSSLSSYSLLIPYSIRRRLRNLKASAYDAFLGKRARLRKNNLLRR